eukprot:TRINITY_DN2821_c0_g1_i3.p1 TRINITY_DN2821_c0_g1~~TRINITY_DN2821_c0_g1_i3.p1  ORF type:complete len:438 (+),score=120.62 TRINITY_DN2821_c0_g1_i3:163-1476(+)
MSKSIRKYGILDVSKEVPDGKIHDVEKLILSNRNIDVIEDLGACKNLKKILLKQNRLESYSGVVNCYELISLDLSFNRIAEMIDMTNLTKLTFLNLSNNKIRRIQGMNKLYNLETLLLNDNDISIIENVKQLRNLRNLVLSDNKIMELGEIPSLQGVQKISLSNNKIRDISKIKNMENLKELRLNKNKIVSLPESLKFNPKLEILDVGNNLIFEEKGIAIVKELLKIDNLNLRGNKIEEQEGFLDKVLGMNANIEVLNNKRVRPTKKFAKNRADRSKGNENKNPRDRFKRQKRGDEEAEEAGLNHQANDQFFEEEKEEPSMPEKKEFKKGKKHPVNDEVNVDDVQPEATENETKPKEITKPLSNTVEMLDILKSKAEKKDPHKLITGIVNIKQNKKHKSSKNGKKGKNGTDDLLLGKRGKKTLDRLLNKDASADPWD